MTRQERLLRAMAPVGGLFLVATLPELRAQGLGHVALYALERTVRESVPWRHEGFPVTALRCETGLTAFEISKACALLKKGNLVTIERASESGRERILMATERGIHVLDKILAAAADRLWEGLPPLARGRRVKETTQMLRKASNKLLGPLQLSIFDKFAPPRATKRPRKRRSSKSQSNRRQSDAADPRLKAL